MKHRIKKHQRVIHDMLTLFAKSDQRRRERILNSRAHAARRLRESS